MRLTPRTSATLITHVIVAFAAISPCAYAESRDDVDPRVSEAMAACLANDLNKGVAILAQLYAETQDAIWVFNQARCYQQNDKLEEARTRFLEFRRKNRRKDRARDARAEEYVAEIDKELERRAHNTARANVVDPPRTERMAAAPAVPAYVPPAQPASRPAADLGVAETKADHTGGPIYGRWWFWAAVGGVLATSLVAIAVASSGTKTVLECGQEECFRVP